MATDSSDWAVRPIAYRRAKRLIGQYHYSMHLPPIEFAFGLIVDGQLMGACCFGYGANRNTMRIIRGQGWGFYELVRLALVDNQRNQASYLIAQSLKSLPQPTAVIAYADTQWGHVGKIYQATNWLYTGLSAPQTEWEIDGRRVHKRRAEERVSKAISSEAHQLPAKRKHRYFYLLGDRREKKRMRQFIEARFGIQPYPADVPDYYDMRVIRGKRHGNGLLD